MKITVITLFPKMITGFVVESILKRAQDKKLVEIKALNLREFAVDDYGKVDDRPYGGGAGMILQVEPIYKALKMLSSQISATKLTSDVSTRKVVLTSPKGRIFNQQVALEYAKLEELVIIAGHYEEVDERVRDYIDEEVSLGDFVMTGGEITAVAIIDAVTRLIPGVLKKNNATTQESFFEVEIETLIKVVGLTEVLLTLKEKGRTTVQLLEHPHYTRPEEFMGKKVPDVLLSGHHQQIKEWQMKMAYKETLKKRPDLLK